MTMIGGTTEGEVFRMLRDSFRKAEGCCRQLAAMRGDARWIAIGNLCEQLYQKSLAIESRKTGRPGTLILPAYANEWRERN